MPRLASSNSSIIFKSSYSPISISFSQYIDQKQDILKPESHLVGSYWSPCQREWSLCDNLPHADRDRALMPEDHEKWTGSLQNSCNLHNSKNSLWLERAQLYLRHSWKILCSLNSFEQYAEGVDWQQQRRPSSFEAHHEMLQSPLWKCTVISNIFRACQVLNKNLPAYLKDPPKNMLDE